MKWKKTTIGEIVKTKKGFAFKSSKYVNIGVPIVRVSNYTNDSISDSDLKYYPFEEKQNYLDFELHEGNIIIQTVGSWPNNPASVVGKVVRVPYYLDGALLNQNAVRLIPGKNIDNDYLFYRLKTNEFQGHVLGEARGAANQASITLETIKSFTFLLPDYATQVKIGKILQSYDNLIENNQKQIRLLEEAAQRLYKDWFVDFHFPGHETVKVVDGVPVGWKKEELSEVFDYIRGKSYTSKELVDKGETLMVNLKNIKAFGGYKRNAEKYFTGNFKKEQQLLPGDIVMGVTDMTQERRLVGHVALIPNLGKTMTFSMDLIKLIPKSITRSYLYGIMKYGGYSKKISPLANGVNVLHLKPESMMNLSMIIPTKDVLMRYEKVFVLYQRKIELLQKQCDIAIEARDRLLPRLMGNQ